MKIVPDKNRARDGASLHVAPSTETESGGAEEGPKHGAELGDGALADNIEGEALLESPGHGLALGCSGDDVVDGLVHAEEMQEGAAVEAQKMIGRQEA